MGDVKFSFQLLDKGNPVFSAFIMWASVLTIKFLLMSTLTAIHRYRSKTAASPEDMAMMRVTELTTNEEVDRVKRAHLNDMENILPFLSVGLFYVLTDPSAMVAIWLFRVTTVARFVHTFVYAIYVVPQPARAICFFTHFGITFYMAFMSILYFI
ncbi:microsomal glutathione S-transferase 1-like isoform X1 [Contarinia nasturtii]|uniref:microsomal glutathione S-transferase 1-like isoform X1 n=1 Tax=Contarinia nasturtii TaxID=265458 RepID=UPI0012D3B0AD|nr:microsomal glutathione S-transferase 1-like isoform X1 [Contarinia nasturtii]